MLFFKIFTLLQSHHDSSDLPIQTMSIYSLTVSPARPQPPPTNIAPSLIGSISGGKKKKESFDEEDEQLNVGERRDKQNRKMEIGQLPEECISHILSFTSPRDACRSSLVSPLFRLAADSDVVWEKFLPSDYRDLISQSLKIPETTLNSMPKKSLYFFLCNNPIIIGNGNMSFSIDRESGKKCSMVGARGLSIAWGDKPQYWEWISLPESRFPEVAKLWFVWWLHVIAKVETRILSPQTTYVAYFIFKLTEHTHGFTDRPVELRVNFEGRENGEGLGMALHSRRNPALVPRDRGDGWKEVEMGEFFNEHGEDGSVLCSLKEVDNYHTKSGLIVEGIELRPRSGG